MFGKSISVEYHLMAKAPELWGVRNGLGNHVVQHIINELYPYLLDTEEVRSIINKKLPQIAMREVAAYQRANGVVLMSENGEVDEYGTIGLLSRLYEKISTLEQDNKELRLLIQSAQQNQK